jgi:CubicO group peptidase (beta-lactamase class C family)
MARPEKGEENMQDTVFGCASLAKQFTACSIAMVMQQGLVSPRDDIHRFIPGLPGYGSPLTIEHLIHHTGGLKDYRPLLEGIESYGNDDVVKALARQNELDFRPGDKFQYCNSGYLLLAEVVKCITGLPLDRFAHKHIFEPLEMRKTSLGYRKPRKGCAAGYMPDGKGGFITPPSKESTLGPGSLYTTVEDFLKWDNSFYEIPSPLEKDVLPGAKPLRDIVLERGILASGEMLTYAYGLALWDFCGFPVISHEGGAGGYRANMLRFPSLSATVLCMLNNDALDPVEITKNAARLWMR